MDRYLLHKIIQYLIIGAVVGLIIFFGIGCYQWGKSSSNKPPELKSELKDGELIIYQGNTLAPIVQSREAIIYAKVTAYLSVPEQTDSTPFITASGEMVFDGGIACPTNLPFGTFVKIDGKWYECNDRTHPRNDGTFDIWVETIEEAITWGSSTKEITLLTF